MDSFDGLARGTYGVHAVWVPLTDVRYCDGMRRQQSTKETIVADDTKTPRSDRAAPDPAKPQDLPPKEVDAPNADRVKGGVKKTMQTQA
jgi:hypothetical protein